MQWKNKKVIVTGGAGIIGHVLIEKLINRGAIVRCFDIVPKPEDFLSQVEYSQRDLAQLNPIEFTIFNPDIIFHLAATFERSEEQADFWEFNFTNNVLLSHKVIDAVKYCKNVQKFIFASSYLIYDPKTYLLESPLEPVKLSESGRINVRNICGAAKYYTEKELEFLDNFSEYPFSKLSARIFRVYGRNSKDFISRCVRAAIAKEPIKLFLKDNSFDYIFADDVAEGLIRLSESNVKNEIVNLGTSRARKIEEIMSILKGYFPDIRIEEEKNESHFEESLADMNKFKEITGWLPGISLEQGIKEIIDYEIQKKNKN